MLGTTARLLLRQIRAARASPSRPHAGSVLMDKLPHLDTNQIFFALLFVLYPHLKGAPKGLRWRNAQRPKE
jgi:hypothetical protein